MRKLLTAAVFLLGVATGAALTLPLVDRALAQRNDAQLQAHRAVYLATLNNLCIEAAADSADLWAATLQKDKNVKGVKTVAP